MFKQTTAESIKYKNINAYGTVGIKQEVPLIAPRKKEQLSGRKSRRTERLVLSSYTVQISTDNRVWLSETFPNRNNNGSNQKTT
ncbi:hypothetical protein [Candidatus Enterovibrio altilux]|uniref:hypothetical protein n=1 Tax=Candidatus Enterovibrio altilux TaxID=1927128 RepID=UPI00374291B1